MWFSTIGIGMRSHRMPGRISVSEPAAGAQYGKTSAAGFAAAVAVTFSYSGAGLTAMAEAERRKSFTRSISGGGVNANVGCGLLDTPDAAAILLHRDTRPLDLTRTALAAQLADQLEDLPEAGRADRVPLGFETA